MDELEALMILNSFDYMGEVKIRWLLERYGSFLEALNRPLEEIAQIQGFGPKTIEGWKKGLEAKKWKEEWRLAKLFQTKIIPFFSPSYPKRLLDISAPPLLLYVQGELLPQDERSIAVVGTRHCTLYGQEMARELSFRLSEAGFTIVSGLARGIDTAAHQAAIQTGRSVAVLGSGIAELYPRENRLLAGHIAAKGAVISEFGMSVKPARSNFPKRNRIVSAMTLATLLVEAPVKSGAMITVEHALTQKRLVFALPGRCDADSFRGNHQLIKEKKAALIENVADILRFFPGEFSCKPKTCAAATLPLAPLEKELLELFPSQEMSVEQLKNLLPLWPIAQLNSILMSLVLKKAIKEYPGKMYKKANS